MMGVCQSVNVSGDGGGGVSVSVCKSEVDVFP